MLTSTDGMKNKVLISLYLIYIGTINTCYLL